MQPVPSSGRSRPLLSARNLLIGIVLVILAFATVHIVYGSGAKKPTKHAARRPHHALCTPRKHGHSHCRTQTAAGHHTRKQSRAKHATRLSAFHPTAEERYQMHVMHVLDRQRHTFDYVSYDTGIKTLDQLTSACANNLTRISIMTDEVDGIPHPGAWYSSVASFHRRVLQAYHDMASALEVCSTGAGNGDGNSVATARQDLVTATRELHAVDDAAHRAWNHVHQMERRPRR